MRSSLAGVAVAGLVGAAVAILVVASGLGNFLSPGPRGLADATIFLDSNGQGGCRITTIPQTVQASKHGKVEWSILDNCNATTANDVEVKFKSDDPLDPNCNHKGRKAIKCDVNPKKGYGTYSYSVIAGSYREDPDLEIAP